MRTPSIKFASVWEGVGSMNRTAFSRLCIGLGERWEINRHTFSILRIGLSKSRSNWEAHLRCALCWSEEGVGAINRHTFSVLCAGLRKSIPALAFHRMVGQWKTNYSPQGIDAHRLHSLRVPIACRTVLHCRAQERNQTLCVLQIPWHSNLQAKRRSWEQKIKQKIFSVN